MGEPGGGVPESQAALGRKGDGAVGGGSFDGGLEFERALFNRDVAHVGDRQSDEVEAARRERRRERVALHVEGRIAEVEAFRPRDAHVVLERHRAAEVRRADLGAQGALVVVPRPGEVDVFVREGGRPAVRGADAVEECAARHVGLAVGRAERVRGLGAVDARLHVDVAGEGRHGVTRPQGSVACLVERVAFHRRHVVRRERVVFARRDGDHVARRFAFGDELLGRFGLDGADRREGRQEASHSFQHVHVPFQHVHVPFQHVHVSLLSVCPR